jgi:tetratricopeptide (TPR) repeat protein
VSRRDDILWLSGLVIAGLAVGWSLVSTAIADNLAPGNPAAALAWRGNAAGALVGLAERDLEAGRLTSAEANARKALGVDRLQVPALSVLGRAAERRGDTALAVPLMKAAGARNRRDPTLQLWLLRRAAMTGDFNEALARADALSRAEPDLTRRLFPLMMDMAARPGGVTALAARLAQEPPWRGGFMTNWVRNAPSADGPIGLMDAMAVQGAPATPLEKGLIQTRLVRDGRFQQAFVLWAQDLPPARLNALADVNDSGFEGTVAEGPFGWDIERNARGVADFESAPGRSGRALHLVFDGRPAPQILVRQLLVLPPGPRVLTGEVKADHFETIEGLGWAIRCAGENHAVVLRSPPLRGASDWRRFSVTFDVPAEGCDGQWLALMVLGQTAGARRSSGEVWFDNVTIQR